MHAREDCCQSLSVSVSLCQSLFALSTLSTRRRQVLVADYGRGVIPVVCCFVNGTTDGRLTDRRTDANPSLHPSRACFLTVSS
jgi:hypothetical protein